MLQFIHNYIYIILNIKKNQYDDLFLQFIAVCLSVRFCITITIILSVFINCQILKSDIIKSWLSLYCICKVDIEALQTEV